KSPPSDEQREGSNKFYGLAKEASSTQSLGLLLLQIILSPNRRRTLLGIETAWTNALAVHLGVLTAVGTERRILVQILGRKLLVLVMDVLGFHSGRIPILNLLQRERLAYRKLDGTSISLLDEEGEKALDRNLVVVEVIREPVLLV